MPQVRGMPGDRTRAERSFFTLVPTLQSAEDCYNAAHRGAETDVFPVTAALGMPVVAYTALRWGALMRPTREDPKVTFASRWEDAVAALRAKHGPHARVAVFPCASIQLAAVGR